MRDGIDVRKLFPPLSPPSVPYLLTHGLVISLGFES